MDDDFDILGLLISDKSKDDAIKEAIVEICSKPIMLNTGTGIEYSINQSDFEKWLIDNGFMDDFQDDEIAIENIPIAVRQAAIAFIVSC
jgi:hypothetical protein